jgi:hypothetical protein
LKRHKSWIDQECSELLAERKKFSEERGNFLKYEINELETRIKTKIKDFYRGINNLR